jgi:hypothetical protein
LSKYKTAIVGRASLGSNGVRARSPGGLATAPWLVAVAGSDTGVGVGVAGAGVERLHAARNSANAVWSPALGRRLASANAPS